MREFVLKIFLNSYRLAVVLFVPKTGMLIRVTVKLDINVVF